MVDLQPYRSSYHWSTGGLGFALLLGAPAASILGALYGTLIGPAVVFFSGDLKVVILMVGATFALVGFALFQGSRTLVRWAEILNPRVALLLGLTLGLAVYHSALAFWSLRVTDGAAIVFAPWSQLLLLNMFSKTNGWFFTVAGHELVFENGILQTIYLVEFVSCLALTMGGAYVASLRPHCESCRSDLPQVATYRCRVPDEPEGILSSFKHKRLKSLIDQFTPDVVTDDPLEWGLDLTLNGCIECLKTFTVSSHYFDWRSGDLKSVPIHDKARLDPDRAVELLLSLDPAEAKDLREALDELPETHWIDLGRRLQYDSISTRPAIVEDFGAEGCSSGACPSCRGFVAAVRAARRARPASGRVS